MRHPDSSQPRWAANLGEAIASVAEPDPLGALSFGLRALPSFILDETARALLANAEIAEGPLRLRQILDALADVLDDVPRE